MTKEQMFSNWAPPSSFWSPWVKPVLFSQMSETAYENIETPDPPIWAEPANGSTAMVVDLPGVRSVACGLSLLTLGYRPIPLFNARPEGPAELSLVAVRPIMTVLAKSAFLIRDTRLPDGAPPVFLLDSDRRTSVRSPAPGMLDNRSISLPTDFPSGNLLQSQGIKRVLLIQSEPDYPQADLSHTLRRWQDAGLQIMAQALSLPGNSRPITVQTPRRYKMLWYNMLATMGLKSSPLGGFGGYLPLPSAG